MDFINRLRALARNESGQDLLEYALLIALIAIVAFVAVQSTGTTVSGIFSNIQGQLAGTGTP